MRCEEKFFKIYNREPENIVFCPYRVCPIEAHSDHQHGGITGLAIDRGIYIALPSQKEWGHRIKISSIRQTRPMAYLSGSDGKGRRLG